MKFVPKILLLICFVLQICFSICYASSSTYEGAVWRFAEKHEYTDTEPSEFSYITFNNHALICRDNTPYGPKSISVYKVVDFRKNHIKAKIIAYFEEEENSGYTKASFDKNEYLDIDINGKDMTVYSKTNSSSNEYKYKRIEFNVIEFFPDFVLNKYLYKD